VTDLFAAGPNKTTADSTSGFIPPPLLMSFSHECVTPFLPTSRFSRRNPLSNDITPLISALGLWNESSYAPLDPTEPKANRKFRSSYAISFAGRVALERMTCGTKGTTVRVRVRLFLHPQSEYGDDIDGCTP
jgi:acid phosphatase